MRVSLRPLLQAVSIVVVGAVVAAMVIPYAAVEYVLRHVICVKRAANFLDTVAPGLDHLLAFASAGLAVRLGWRAGRAWQLATGCLLLAMLVECAQIWIPGRQPAVSHVLLDVAGAVAGFGSAWLVTYAWGEESLPQGFHASTHWVGEDRNPPSLPSRARLRGRTQDRQAERRGSNEG
jgi:hypothetical protein